MSTVWVYAEVDNGKLEPATLELLTKARDLGNVEAVALGPGSNDAAKQLGEYGAEIVYASDDDVYGDYIAQPHVHALAELIGENAPDMIMFPMTYDSRDIAGRLSARLGSTLMSNVMDIESVDVAKTAIFGGSQIVDVALEGTPKLVLVRPKSFVAEPSGGEATVVPVEVEIPEEAKKAKRLERHEEQASGPKLEDAPVVISGGRGLQEPGNFELLDQLASAIGNAAVGATRAVVDAGWVPYAYQIGQTGKTVKPGVYIAIGISGATQHIVGMKGAKKIIAINKDEEAPIFQIADLGIVGDALKIVPQLIEEVKSRKG
ncbi:MAG: electron transfer flavoprotein alpha subunit [Actinomycetota bacterium]|jgi:electron transfer flavoprotein alpha subunit|nr:electron transfer flavoprotein alpha subunit [Actinomycetota bacterium]